jgi:2-polyprenyl-6-hydroxyphenyl methylase/3-demethylubiquinone-9 3-methyltransferase
VDFNKYCSVDNYYEFGFSGVAVDYLRCTGCGFLFTTFADSWSTTDFRELIYNDDYVKVDGEYAEIRPARTAAVIAEWFRGAEEARILDYGSGAGEFARRMRQAGYNHVREYDPFSSPERPHDFFDIITCFEVIEHTPDPRGTLADLVSSLKPDGCVLLSQSLQPDDILSIRSNWWYLAPRNGHLSTYTEEALELLGREHGLLFYRGDTVYGFAGPSPSRYAQIALSAIGPSFSTLRLLAPEAMVNVVILSPDRSRVVWHRSEILGSQRIRWTGTNRRLQWRAKWSPVSRIRVHIPVAHEAAAGFAEACTLSLDGMKAPTKMVRGDLAAEFDVVGKIRADIELLTPDPVTVQSSAGRRVGIAVPVGRRPPVPPDP